MFEIKIFLKQITVFIKSSFLLLDNYNLMLIFLLVHYTHC